MVEDTGRQGNAMAMCPMAKICMGMMRKPPSGLLLMLPGAMLIGAGLLILVAPAVLVWLAGTAAVLLGIMLLVMASFVRRLGRDT